MAQAPAAPLQSLQCHAARGDRASQVALARRLETGDGIASDPKRAADLYRAAATAVPSSTAIYSPPVRKGGQGQMMFLTNPNASLGSAEALYRLGRMYIDGRGVESDPSRGRAMIRQAAEQGFPEAQAEVSVLGN
jgi:TPR repeat protein